MAEDGKHYKCDFDLYGEIVPEVSRELYWEEGGGEGVGSKSQEFAIVKNGSDYIELQSRKGRR